MAAKKITKFKSKKGASTSGGAKPSLGGGAKNVKKGPKTGSTVHALPSQAQVLQQQQQAALPKAAPPATPPPPAPKAAPPPLAPAAPVPKVAPPLAPPPPAKTAVPPLTPGRPSQSQTMTAPAPGGPGARTGASLPVNTAAPAPGGMKGRTLPGSVPGIMKTKTQSSASLEDLPVEKQLEIKTEELTDQVTNMLEVADSLLDPYWTPENIIDIIHVLVRSLNLDVVSLVLPAINYPQQLDVVLNRGYELSPPKSITDLWLKTFDDKAGIDWKKLMKLAEDNKSDLAYWIVSEGLNSIGYVPIRDGDYIYGFLFVASIGKKVQSPLTAPLLDLCGSHIGLTYALKIMKG